MPGMPGRSVIGLLTFEEASDWLWVDEVLLREWVKEGRGPATINLPKGARPECLRFRVQDLERWVQSLRGGKGKA